MSVALVTAAAARDLDDDLAPLTAALAARDVANAVVRWDDPAVDWTSFDLVVVRSVWDYVHRRDEFLAWAEATSAATRLKPATPPAVMNVSSAPARPSTSRPRGKWRVAGSPKS